MYIMKKCSGCQRTFPHFAYYEINKYTNDKLRLCSTCCQSRVTNHQDICFCWKPLEKYAVCDLCRIDLSRHRLHIHSRDFGEWHSCLVCSCHSGTLPDSCRCKFPIQGPRYNCDTCGDQFLLMRHFQNHRCRRHSAVVFFTCEVCQAKFDYKESLTRHMAVHTTKTYVCDMCDKTFQEKEHLVAHYKSHTGNMSYSCDICGKIFCRRDNFVAHYRVHSGEKPFKCDICHKEFAWKTSLYSHIKRHYSEKTYSCDKCEKSFTSKILYHKHVETPSGSYGCDMCCKKFNTKRRFETHVKNHGLEPSNETEIIDLTVD